MGRGCGRESEETQDYERESLNLSREEAEEIRFVPSALSIPRGPMFWCDNRWSDKALRFWQFASIVVNDVEEPYTVNLCQQCYKERLTTQGLAPLKSWQWKAVVEQKAPRGRFWKNVGKRTSLYKECGSMFLLRERKRKSFERMLRRKNRKGYKANGNKSLFPKNLWNKLQPSGADRTAG